MAKRSGKVVSCFRLVPLFSGSANYSYWGERAINDLNALLNLKIHRLILAMV